MLGVVTVSFIWVVLGGVSSDVAIISMSFSQMWPVGQFGWPVCAHNTLEEHFQKPLWLSSWGVTVVCEAHVCAHMYSNDCPKVVCCPHCFVAGS